MVGEFFCVSTLVLVMSLLSAYGESLSGNPEFKVLFLKDVFEALGREQSQNSLPRLVCGR